MARYISLEDVEFYRSVITTDAGHVYYNGPYSTVGAAKAQARNKHTHYIRGEYTGAVQRLVPELEWVDGTPKAVLAWEDVAKTDGPKWIDLKK